MALSNTIDVLDDIERILNYSLRLEGFREDTGLQNYKDIVSKCKMKGGNVREKLAVKHKECFLETYMRFSESILLEDFSFLETSDVVIVFGPSGKSQFPMSKIYRSLTNVDQRDDFEGHLYFILRHVATDEDEINELKTICSKFETEEPVQPSRTKNALGDLISTVKQSVESAGISSDGDNKMPDFNQIGSIIQTIFQNDTMKNSIQSLVESVGEEGKDKNPMELIGTALKVAQDKMQQSS